ncbi:TPA: hypothetical protein EYP70_00390 [Candidatus Bathyarchaeota archaeon]|nr:hypothetical protein [Candidatus Bathyarchaeota archaeon]
MKEITKKHYSHPLVLEEIESFCRGRWIAFHCIDERNRLILRRYIDGKPLAISNKISLFNLIKCAEALNLTVRTVYATANLYQSTCSIKGIYDISKIKRCTPTWDIDSSLERWPETLKVAKRIINILDEMGVRESVYIKWSGNGCHIHIHENAISKDILSKYHPLDLAYAIVEYVRRRFTAKMGCRLADNVKVENKIDLTRVFTAPLSLHRKLDVVCVCFRPKDISKFDPQWIKPMSFRHDFGWKQCSEGEADDLALKAYYSVGGYSLKKRKTEPLDKQIMKWMNKY